MFPWHNMDIKKLKISILSVNYWMGLQMNYIDCIERHNTDIYKETRHDLNKLIAEAKLSYYNDKIRNGCHDQVTF